MQNAPGFVFGQPPVDIACRDRPAAYAVISNADGKIAVVRYNVRGRDFYWLPGGGKDEGETPEETIVREIREELGRHVKIRRAIGNATQYFFASDDDCWYRMTADFFTAELGGDAGNRREYSINWVDATCQSLVFFHACHAWAVRKAAE